MSNLNRQIWKYAVAIASVLIAFLLMLVLNPYIQLTQASFMLFFAPITISAWYGGKSPGVVATLLSALLVNYFFVNSTYSLSLMLASGARALLFIFEGIFVSTLVSSLRSAQRQTQRSLEQLQLSESKFRRLVESDIIGIVCGDIHGAITEANNEFLRMTGFTHQDVSAGRVRWDEMTPADLRDRDVPALEELLDKGKNTAYEKAYIGKDGHRVPVIVGAALLEEDPESVISFVLDLTKQKQAQEALQESEARFRRIFECNMIGIGIWTATGGVTHANDALLNLIGYTRQELETGLINWRELTPPEYISSDEDSIAEMAVKGFSTPVEKEYIHKDGRRIPILIGGTSFPDSPESGVFFVVDLTERKRTEEALRRSEESLRAAQELSLDAFTILQSVRNQAGEIIDFEWTYVNPKAAEILHNPVEALIGQRLLEVLPGNKTNSELFERYVRVVETGEPHDIELPYESEGITGWFRNMAVKLGDGVAISFGDITHRKRTEQALKASEERYRYLSEAIPQLVWTADAEGRNDYLNQQMCHYTGLDFEQLLGLDWQRIIHPDDLEPTYTRWMESVQNGTAYENEYRLRRTDGMYRWHLVRGIPLRNEQGRVVKWFGVCTDIHEQKEIEAQRTHLLQQEQAARAEAEKANRIKDEFIAVVSHELRSPLNPILGWAQMLQTRRFDEQATMRALQTIERNAKLQAKLIEDLLDVSRILRGKLALNVDPVDLVSTIEAARETMRLAAEAKGIHIQTLFAPDVGLVRGDSGRLQQVVWNLLSNAIKFTPAGGQIEVSLEQVGNCAQIQVKDTGKGITAEFLPYVFEYFRQADSATTRRFGGLGLGLAIVRHLVELHGGTVQAESPGEGMGATFRVKLPLIKDVVQSHQNNGQETATDLNGMGVLVVDDEADMRELTAAILKQSGAKVQVAASAAEALECLDQFQPDILISDIGMPEVDGYMLMRLVRARSPQQGGLIPAIALTAYAGEANEQLARKAGFQKHIAKPIEANQLIKMVSTFLKVKTA